MPQYMLLIYPPVDFEPPGEVADRLAAWQAYTDSLDDAGVLVTTGRLQDVHSATSVSARDGETLISDGPYAETKEYLAGFYLVDCADLDAALGHAARMPSIGYGKVEVRPMMFPLATPASQMGTQTAA